TDADAGQGVPPTAKPCPQPGPRKFLALALRLAQEFIRLGDSSASGEGGAEETAHAVRCRLLPAAQLATLRRCALASSRREQLGPGVEARRPLSIESFFQRDNIGLRLVQFLLDLT